MLTGHHLGRYERRRAYRALHEGRTREGCQPQVSMQETVALAQEVAPRVLESPEWARQSASTRLDWIATEVLRLERQADAREDGFREANYLHAHYREYSYLSVSQISARQGREIPFPEIGAVVEGILANRVAWVSGRVLDPPNKYGYRERLAYYIRWRATHVFPEEMEPR